MSQKKVNQDYSLTDGTCGNAGEGLCVLAGMIARRLVARKSGVEGQHPCPGLPSGRSDKKAGLQSPGKADRKHAVTPSDCSKLDMPDVVIKEGER